MAAHSHAGNMHIKMACWYLHFSFIPESLELPAIVPSQVLQAPGWPGEVVKAGRWLCLCFAVPRRISLLRDSISPPFPIFSSASTSSAVLSVLCRTRLGVLGASAELCCSFWVSQKGFWACRCDSVYLHCTLQVYLSRQGLAHKSAIWRVCLCYWWQFLVFLRYSSLDGSDFGDISHVL